MILLALTTDKIDLVTDAAATLDVHVSYIDASNTTLVPSGGGKQNTAIVSAATTDILAVPGASTLRNVKTINIRNKHATQATACTVRFNANATIYELFSVTLLAGMVLEYIEGVGWFTVSNARMDRWLRVSGSDYVNATTSFTDITGLTCNVESGKVYNFEAHLYHFANATTTGPRFGINGPTLTAIQANAIDVVVAGVDTATMRAGSAQAVDTSSVGASLTGRITTPTLAIVSGAFTTGAVGTFAMRGQSEIAVAAGLTVRVGSWCHVWEATG